MKLASARALKEEILSTTLRPRTIAKAYSATLRDERSADAEPPKVLETVALGISRGKHRRDFRLAVRIQSSRLRLLQYIQLFEQLRAPTNELDVRMVGSIHKMQWWRRRQRPLKAGSSTGHVNVTAGTLGCFVGSRRTGEKGVYLLSNNHVVADENRSAKGDPIVQPGPLDGGKAVSDAVAVLHRFKPLLKNKPNVVDAGIAALAEGQSWQQLDLSPFNSAYGKLRGLADADIGQPVAKLGRTTGFTLGRVSAIEVDNVVVGYDMGNLRFDNQIEIEAVDRPFSRGGDSGSVIMTRGGKAIGLLFAGSENGGRGNHGLTYANPMDTVLDGLGIDLLLP